MTKYEMLQHLLNHPSLHESIMQHLEFGKAKMLLREHEFNDYYYFLDVHVVDDLDGKDVLISADSFEIELDCRDSVKSFVVRMPNLVTVDSAIESANLGKIIEEFLRSRLN